MFTDFISREKKIIEYNTRFVPTYNPFYPALSQKLYDQTHADIMSKGVEITDFNDLQVVHPHDTEINHIKSKESSFSFKLALKLARHNISDFQTVDTQEAVANVLTKLLFQFDKFVLNGDNIGNVGIYNNPNTITNSAESISTVTQLTQLIEAIKYDVAKNTGSDINDIIFMIAGRKANSLFGQVVTDNFGQNRITDITNGNLVRMHGRVEEADKIIALSPANTILHRGIAPQVYQVESDRLNYSTSVDFAYSSCSVEVQSMGGIIVAPLTIS